MRLKGKSAIVTGAASAFITGVCLDVDGGRCV